MATQEIDKLALDLEVTGLDQSSVDNVTKLADALEKLQNTLESGSFSKLKDLGIKLNTKSFEKQLTEVKKLADNTGKTIKKDLEKTISNINAGDKAIPKIQVVSAEDVDTTDVKAMQNLINNKHELKNLDKALDSVTAQDKKLSGIAGKIQALNSPIKEVNKNAEKTASKKGGIGKFIDALKRVAIYRFIRTVIKQISQAFQEGVKNVALFDSNANKTMSQLSTSLINIKNSLGLMLQPFFETIAPVVQQISQAFVEIGNAVSKANAQMKGLATYTKISSKYMADYKKSIQSASTFSFDTFNVLSGSNEQSSMFETEQIEETNAGLNEMQNFLQSIKGLIEKVFDTIKIIASFLTKTLADIGPAITIIANMITDIFDFLNPMLESIVGMLQPIFDVLLKDLLPALLECIDTILQPILAVLQLIWAVVEPIVQTIVEVLKPVIEAISNVVSVINELLKPGLELITNILETVTPIVSAFMEIEATMNILAPIVQLISDLIAVILEGVKGIGSLLKGDVSGAWEHFKNMGTGAWDAIKDFGLNVWDKLKSVGESFVNVWDKIKEAGEKCWNAVKKAGVVMAEAVVNGLLAGLNWIIKMVNNITSGMSKVWSWAGIPEIPNIPQVTWRLSIDSYANGGKLTGELWQMNEMGNPEMLFNSRNSGNTSVINQAQLGEAFLQAILNSGVIDAIRESGNIVLDGKDIAQSRSFKRELNRTNPNLNLR